MDRKPPDKLPTGTDPAPAEIAPDGRPRDNFPRAEHRDYLVHSIDLYRYGRPLHITGCFLTWTVWRR